MYETGTRGNELGNLFRPQYYLARLIQSPFPITREKQPKPPWEFPLDAIALMDTRISITQKAQYPFIQEYTLNHHIKALIVLRKIP